MAMEHKVKEKSVANGCPSIDCKIGRDFLEVDHDFRSAYISTRRKGYVLEFRREFLGWRS